MDYNRLNCRDGGTGRRARLKLVWEQSHEGSTPSRGTKKINNVLFKFINQRKELKMSIRAVAEIDDLVAIKNVLISVSDKEGLDVLVAGLIENCPDLMIYSNGGTYRYIKEILGEKKTDTYLKEMPQFTNQAELYFFQNAVSASMDLFVINFCPFKQVVEKEGISFEEALRDIDVYRTSALRLAAKNWHRVMCLPYSDLKVYREFVIRLRMQEGHTDLSMRFDACRMTFAFLKDYDQAVYDYLHTTDLEEVLRCYTIH